MNPQTTRLAFMGTPDFAAKILNSLFKANYPIVAVYTQPPRPVGRGYKITPSPVQSLAEAYNLPVFTPSSLKADETQKQWRDLDLDIAIIAAYGLILPKAILEAPKMGCINVHTSLLPRWRGAAPIQRAILEGDPVTGVTLMKMDEGLDTGDILVTRKISILPKMTSPELLDKLNDLATEALIEAIPAYLEGRLIPTPQPQEGITYAAKLEKREGILDWNLPAAALERKIRALNPWPGTWFTIGEDRIKVLDAEVVPLTSIEHPGRILDDRLTIACGENALRLLWVQKIGKSPLPTDEFLRGYEIPSKDLLNEAV